MKRIIVMAALFAATSAHAVVNMYAGNGTGKIIGTYPTFEACVLAGNAGTKKFTCKGTITPTPCPAQPASETRTQACPTGAIGSWTQTRRYATAPSPTCWVVGAWLPVTAPDGACVETQPPAVGSATLSWSVPITRADGTALIGAVSYRVLYGRASGTYAQSLAAIASPVTVPNLAAGAWFFAVEAIDAAGNASATAFELDKVVQ